MCCSGGEVGQTDKALQKSQAAMTDTLNKDYSVTFAEQQDVLAQQRAKLAYIAANPTGYTPEELHTATTSINENTATAAKQAMGAAAAFAASHGGADVGGGGAAQMAGQIASGAAQSKAQALAALSTQNQAMKRQNLWSALSGLQDVGSEYGGAGSTSISGAGSSAGSAVNAGSGALAAQQAQWGNMFGIISGIGGLASAAVPFMPKSWGLSGSKG